MNTAIFMVICALVILLGLEIRHRETTEELSRLKNRANTLEEEIIRLKMQVKMKKNVYEENA